MGHASHPRIKPSHCDATLRRIPQRNQLFLHVIIVLICFSQLIFDGVQLLLHIVRIIPFVFDFLGQLLNLVLKFLHVVIHALLVLLRILHLLNQGRLCLLVFLYDFLNGFLFLQ